MDVSFVFGMSVHARAGVAIGQILGTVELHMEEIWRTALSTRTTPSIPDEHFRVLNRETAAPQVNDRMTVRADRSHIGDGIDLALTRAKRERV